MAEETIEVFDSLGTSESYIARNIPFKGIYEFNVTALQCDNSSLCGGFSLYFIIFRLFNLDLDFQQFLQDFFDINCSKNEIQVNEFLESL